MRNSVFIPAALTFCIVYGVSAAPLSVTASGGPGVIFSSTAATFVDVLAPATVQIGMDYSLGCTPQIADCPAFNIQVGFTGAVLQWSTLSSGGDLLPFEVCGGLTVGSPGIPLSCVENVQPGIYEVSALLNVQTTSPGAVASAAFVTGTISVISGGPVVATPEPCSAMLLGFGCMLLCLPWIQRRKIISAGASGCFSRHSA